MIDRNKNFEATSKEAFHQASYLARTRGKENHTKGAWLVTGTRIPKNNPNNKAKMTTNDYNSHGI